ncbi:thioether cross-link-forming SCIFF peptide maturase [Pectinatus sottacetonis]|uniref:thioether cross-link-forming SCIFF peptide maturase n=1 Tax=Pectinatus sottacetonis TaxID=1002795 RepID=UPI0018C4C9A7|nr:thioether cross-link-forming SCIFF peptide maturase [Pectinatus sottacetonis]
MNANIHKFQYKDIYFLLDVNSGTVHVIDKMVNDIMDIFDGKNDTTVENSLKDIYKKSDLTEALGELHKLINAGELFAPDIDVPPVFAEKGVVKSMCLLVAHDCNFRCKYCFADSGEYGGVDRSLMSNEVGEAAVEYIIKHSGSRKHCEMDFFGGEPLINMPVVKHVTAYVRKREKETGKLFNLTLTTNGMLLNDENIAFLNDNNISVVISLDGRKEVHDRMRPDVGGNGTYDKVVANFKKFVKSRNDENYYMRGTYTKYNLDFTRDVLSMADEGFDILSVEPVIAKEADYAILESDLPRIFEEYDHLVEAYLDYRHKGKGFFFFHFNIDLNKGPCVVKKLSGCGAGHEYYAVAANGDMYPCHQFVGRKKYLLGNVFEGVKNTKLPAYFRNCHVLNKEKCRECWARFFCSGGCHANADLFNNDIYKPYEIGCELQKKRLESAIVVQSIMALEDK